MKNTDTSFGLYENVDVTEVLRFLFVCEYRSLE